MLKLKENPEKLIEEMKVQELLNNAIDNNKSFVFNAGAGSGKTYALIESLKYIVKHYGENLSNQNKHVLCITFTNAAADNIKSKFGNSDIVKVSTIHERVWELIHLQQDALLIEHEIKINKKLVTLKESFENSPDEEWLNSADKEKFNGHFLLDEAKNTFYNSTNHTSDFGTILEDFGYTLKNNLGKFRKAVKYLHETNKLQKCLNRIKSGENKEVRYNPNFNSDRLHYMLISHNTLLEYGLELCKKYPTLRRIIVDSYPYVLIDEYQDTHKHVIQFMYELIKDTELSHKFLLGYYGDVMQSIYSEGISNSLNEYHPNLLKIEKKYNRRSRNEIINISNKLRNDEISQESIYENNDGGSFSFHKLISERPNDSSTLVRRFIESELSSLNEDVVHCLVLKNEMLAELSGFKDLFNCFKAFFFFNEQAQKVLSRDLTKLDTSIRIILALIEFRELIAKPQKTLEDILPKEKNPVSMFDAHNYLNELNILIDEKINTFEDYLVALFQLYDSGSYLFKCKLKDFFPSDNFGYSLEGFKQLLNNDLPKSDSIKEENRINQINIAISISLNEFTKWYEFITESSSEPVRFNTYHSTKGLEYSNVVIIMENSFSRDRSYFPNFFKDPQNIDFQERRNLLYVACSRAIDNMRILYIDPIDSFREEASLLFGEAKRFVL